MSAAKAPFISGTLRAIRVVLRAFTGVRGAEAHRNAAEGLGPKHFIAAAVTAMVILVVILMAAVKFVLSK